MKRRKCTLAIICSAMLLSGGPAFAAKPPRQITQADAQKLMMDVIRMHPAASRDMGPIEFFRYARNSYSMLIQSEKEGLKLPQREAIEAAEILRKGYVHASDKIFRMLNDLFFFPERLTEKDVAQIGRTMKDALKLWQQLFASVTSYRKK